MLYEVRGKGAHTNLALLQELGLAGSDPIRGDTAIGAFPHDTEGLMETALKLIAEGHQVVLMSMRANTVAPNSPAYLIIGERIGQSAAFHFGYTLWAPADGGPLRLVPGNGSAGIYFKMTDRGLKRVQSLRLGLEPSLAPGIARAMERLTRTATRLALLDGAEARPLAA